MNLTDLDKFYTSPYDEMFHRFDQKHKKSASQLREIKKHERIARLRDDANAKDGDREIWEGF